MQKQPQADAVLLKQSHTGYMHTVEHRFYSGIIPSPEMMEQYKMVDKQLPSRLVQLAEEEALHRRRIARRLATFHFVSKILGQLLALVAVLFVGYLSYAYLKNGNPEQGKVIAVSTIVGLASLFLGVKIFMGKKEEEKKE